MNWIAVADINTLTLQDAGRILCRQKMRMTGFKSIYALIDFLKENRPDLILLGDVVEGLGCSEAIALLRQTMKKDDEIPILLMADKGAQNPALGGHSEVVRGVVTKPLDQAELLERVRKILTLQEPSDQHEIPMIRNTIDDIASTLDECNDASNGIWMGKEAFENAYRHMLRYLERYQGIAFQVLFTVEMSRNTPEPQRAEILRRFRVLLQGTLQSSDMMMERGENQFFLLLPEVEESDIGHVISGVISQWKMTEYGDSTDIASEVRRAKLIADETSNSIRNRVDWVVVVDDDVTNLKMAGHILSKQQMRVTALKSGRALLDYVRSHKPDLILLDVRMPEMDGFETLELLKQQMAPGQEIPVIFLTSVDNAEYEMKGLELGAMDFIKKPFVPGVLISRVKHIIQLVRLQKNLSDEVEIKT
jgi:DNA-binding response OmpR family regulator